MDDPNSGPLRPSSTKCHGQPEVTALLIFAFALGAAAIVEAAGHFFKLNKNFGAGARTLILMAAIWFAVKASRETVTPQATPPRSGIELGQL